MNLIVNGQEVDLYEKEVEAAKKMVMQFFESVHSVCMKHKNDTLYLTTLIMAQYISAEIIEEAGAGMVLEVLANAGRKERDIKQAVYLSDHQNSDNK